MTERWHTDRHWFRQGRFFSTAPGKCGCGHYTLALTCKYPNDFTNGTYECPRCYDARRTMEGLDIVVNE